MSFINSRQRLIKAHIFRFTASNTWRLSVTFDEKKNVQAIKVFRGIFSLPQFKESFPCATHKNRNFIVDFVQHNTLIASWKWVYNSILVVLSSALTYVSFGFAVSTWVISSVSEPWSLVNLLPSRTWKRDLNPRTTNEKLRQTNGQSRNEEQARNHRWTKLNLCFWILNMKKIIRKNNNQRRLRSFQFKQELMWNEGKIFLIAAIRWMIHFTAWKCFPRHSWIDENLHYPKHDNVYSITANKFSLNIFYSQFPSESVWLICLYMSPYKTFKASHLIKIVSHICLSVEDLARNDFLFYWYYLLQINTFPMTLNASFAET